MPAASRSSPTTSPRRKRPPWSTQLPPTHAHGLPGHAQDRTEGVGGPGAAPCGPAPGQHPPIIVVQADSPGNKGRRGREVPVPADLVESLRDLASSHSKNHYQPMLNLSRQRIGQVMKDRAVPSWDRPRQGPPARLPAHLRPQLRAAGRPIPVLQKWLGHASMVDTNATWSWPGRTTNGLAGGR